MKWRSMEQWRKAGPENGTKILVLTQKAQRHVAHYNGFSLHWVVDTPDGAQNISSVDNQVIAWAPILDVPEKLTSRNAFVKAERRRLAELEQAPL